MPSDPYSDQSFREYLDILRYSESLRGEFTERLKGPEFLSAYVNYLANNDEQCRQLLGDFCMQAKATRYIDGLRALVDLGLLDVRGVDFMRLYSSYCHLQYDQTWIAIKALKYGNLTFAEITEHASAMLDPGWPKSVDFIELQIRNIEKMLGPDAVETPMAPAGGTRPASRKDFN